jgi:phage terminase Nu1 subunit (DNA packaging protein)
VPRDSPSLESDLSHQNSRIVATTSPASTKNIFAIDVGDSRAGFRLVKKSYSTKANARKAARKAGLDPDLVRESAAGKFEIDVPPPPALQKGEIDLPSISWLLDCTPRTIQKLAAKGIIVRLGSGRFDEKTSIRNAIRYYREQSAGRTGQDGTTDSVAAGVELKQVNTQLIRLRLQKEAGELVTVDEVRETWGRIMRGIRQFVLALPGKIAFEVPTLSTFNRGVIERICRDELEDAARGRGFDMNDQTGGDHDLPTND